MGTEAKSIGDWLKESCTSEGLSLRQAAAKTGLSHATIRDIIKGGSASAETIRKLSHGFGGDGHESLALEDQLLILANCRSPRPGQDLSPPLGRLMDRVSQFDERQLGIMARFAEFLAETEKDEPIA